MESTFALNVVQTPDHCFIIGNIFFSVVLRGVADSESGFIFINIGAFGKQSDCDTFLVLLCITSWKT